MNFSITHIDWHLISKALKFYEDKKFKYIETPYIVETKYINYTKPHKEQNFVLNHGLFKNNPHELVGSAEQGFIYYLLNGILKDNKLCSITPCFRTENYDKFHQPWFIKLELFHLSKDINDLNNMVESSLEFFKTIYPHGVFEKIITSEYSFDINLNNIEIGSYGFRNIENHSFIYGTGIALPRLSLVGLNE